MNFSTARLIGRQHGDALRPFVEIAEPVRQAPGARRRPPRPRREISPDARWRAPPSAPRGSRVSFSATAIADRGVRIDEMAGLAQHGADGRGGLVLVGAVGGEAARGSPTAPARQREAPRLRERPHQRAHRRGVAAVGLEQQPLEIRRDLDVHRGRRGRHHLAHLVGAGRERARQDVVDVGGDHQPVDRQAHALARHSRRRCRRNFRSAP